MRKISVNTKTGFTSNDPSVTIYDNAGRIWYIEENQGHGIYFNVPPGNYYSNNTLEATTPREYVFIDLPKPNAPKPLPVALKIVFCHNPNKCSVDNENGIVYFDYSFQNAPQYVLDFIIGHEIGHYYFSEQGNLSELLCDEFSYNYNLAKGYNPFQLEYAQDSTLSKSYKANKRRAGIYHYAKKNY